MTSDDLSPDQPPQPLPQSLPLATAIRSHVFDTVRLAVPVMFSRAGLLLLTLVDTMMVGRFGAQDLAYLSLGIGPQLVLMLVAIGVLQGGIVLTAQAYGAGEYKSCGDIWRVSLAHAAVLGLIFAGISMFGGTLTRALGIEEDLARGAGAVAVQFAWGMPGMLLYIACGYLLEGIRRPKVGMVITLSANLVNVALNIPFIYGWGNVIPAMGATGAVGVTSFIRWMLFVVILAYVIFVLDREKYGIHMEVRDLLTDKARTLGRRIRRLGAPMGISQAVESSAMAGLIFMAGNMGAVATASHQVTMNVVQFFYMIAIGMGAAASVRVGFAVGGRDLHSVRLSGWTAVGLLASIMIPTALVIVSLPVAIASVFTSDPGVLEIAKVSVVIGGLLITFNGTMNVLMGSLRGTGDVWVPMGIQSFSFWVVAVPLASYFGFGSGFGGGVGGEPGFLHVAGMGQNAGAPGLIFGLFMGVLVACLLLGLRFWYVASRPISRR